VACPKVGNVKTAIECCSFIIIKERDRKMKNKFYLKLSIGGWLQTDKRKRITHLVIIVYFCMLFSVVIFL
jgi:hypothetical protein